MNFRVQEKALIHLIVMVTLFAVVTGCQNRNDCTGGSSDRLRPVKAIQLSLTSDTDNLEFPATAKATREVNLSFRVGGPLTYLDTETGKKLEKDQLIASIDPRDFSIAVKTLEAKLSSSKAHLEEARLQYERYENLFQQDAAAKARYDNTKAVFQMAEAQVKADSENLDKATNALLDTRLTAPFTGYVHEEFVENHETVTPGQPIVSLVDLSILEVEFGIPEEFVPRVSEFKSYTIIFDAFADQKFSATLKEVGKKPSMNSMSYPITLILDRSSSQVQPGMAARVKIGIEDQSSVKRFTVPASSILNQGDDISSVWIFDPETEMVHLQEVFLEKIAMEGAIVSGRIEEGQWIVTAGVYHLHENQKVRLLEKPTATNVGHML